jgi:hypothetical protein
MVIYKRNKEEPQVVGDSDVIAVCPWCKKGLLFNFSHNHTFNTTSKLVNIGKLEGKEKPKN